MVWTRFFSIKTLKLLLYFYVSKAYFQNRNLLVEYFFFFKLTKWVSSLIVPQSRIACTFLFHSMYFKQPFSKDRLFYKMAETTPEKRREGPYGSRNYDAENETSKTLFDRVMRTKRCYILNHNRRVQQEVIVLLKPIKIMLHLKMKF